MFNFWQQFIQKQIWRDLNQKYLFMLFIDILTRGENVIMFWFWSHSRCMHSDVSGPLNHILPDTVPIPEEDCETRLNALEKASE